MSLTKRFRGMRHDAPLAVDGSHGGSTDLRSFVFDTVLEGMRTSIYGSDPKTDRILYMNGFMKHDYGVEDPEGKVCRAGAAARLDRAMRLLARLTSF